MSQIIEVIVTATGEMRIETKGFAGSACQQATRRLEEALGKRNGEVMTAEFYQSERTQQHTSSER